MPSPLLSGRDGDVISSGSGHRVRLHRTGSIDVDVTRDGRNVGSSRNGGIERNLRSRFDKMNVSARSTAGAGANASFLSSRLGGLDDLDTSRVSSVSSRFYDPNGATSTIADADGSRSFLSQADPESLLRNSASCGVSLGAMRPETRHLHSNTASKSTRTKASDALFDRIDKDKDGTINKREMLLAMRKSRTVANSRTRAACTRRSI